MRTSKSPMSSVSYSKPMSVKRKVPTNDTHQAQPSNKRRGIDEHNEDMWSDSDSFSIAVLDTNTFITTLEKVMNLRYYSSMEVIVPRIVLHELDSLKKREDDTGMYKRACTVSIGF